MHDTISQRTITVSTEGRQIIVRRMKWKAARAFLKKLASHVAKIGGNLADVLPRLPEVVANVEELATELIVNSTSLSAEELDELDLVEGAQVLAAAVALNLGEDLKNSFAGIVGTLAAIMPAMPAAKTNSGEASTPTS